MAYCGLPQPDGVGVEDVVVVVVVVVVVGVVTVPEKGCYIGKYMYTWGAFTNYLNMFLAFFDHVPSYLFISK